MELRLGRLGYVIFTVVGKVLLSSKFSSPEIAWRIPYFDSTRMIRICG